MITVQKQDIGNWLLFEYLSNLHSIREKLHFFEQKYSQKWETFDTDIISSGHESFVQWEDYIEWKAYRKLFEELSVKIDEAKHGDFEIA